MNCSLIRLLRFIIYAFGKYEDKIYFNEVVFVFYKYLHEC